MIIKKTSQIFSLKISYKKITLKIIILKNYLHNNLVKFMKIIEIF